MLSASTLGLSASTDNLDWYWNKFGKGVCFFWIDGRGKLTNQPHSYGNAFMFIFNRSDMCQVFIDTDCKVHLRTSSSVTRTWKAWTTLN